MLALLLAVGTAGCAARATAPRGFLPGSTESQTEAYGAWVDFTYATEGPVQRLQGELLAATADSLWVLGTAGVIGLPNAAIREGRLTAYDSSAGSVGGLAVVGVLTTISNGVFLIFTAPMWIIGGSIATNSQANLPNREVEELEWLQLAAFSRFPAGLPEGVALADIRPKPLTPR